MATSDAPARCLLARGDNLRSQARIGVSSPCSPGTRSSQLRSSCTSGQRMQQERCQWRNSGADQRDRADGLDTYCDMSDLGRGEDRLSWVDNPMSLCHVSTWHKDVPQPSRDDLISPGHSHSRCARPLRARRWRGHRARLKPCGNLCELWRPQAVRRAKQAGRAR